MSKIDANTKNKSVDKQLNYKTETYTRTTCLHDILKILQWKPDLGIKLVKNQRNFFLTINHSAKPFPERCVVTVCAHT